MTEFLAGLILSVLALAAAGGLLHAQWERARCAYVTFEATHARLIGSIFRQESRVRIEETPASVRGTGSCGSLEERVELPRLESRR